MDVQQGFMPSMIVVRFQSTFPLRICEWLLAVIMLSWGLGLLGWPDSSNTIPQFDEMKHMAPLSMWGWACFGAGAVRLIALAINGAWQASPHIRAFCAFVSCFIWLQIAFALTRSEVFSVELAVYPWLLFADMYCVFRSSADARLADDKARGKVTS